MFYLYHLSLFIVNIYCQYHAWHFRHDIEGSLNLLMANQLANEIAIAGGQGNDCKGPYDFFTVPGEPLIREGTSGNGGAMLQGLGVWEPAGRMRTRCRQ